MKWNMVEAGGSPSPPRERVAYPWFPTLDPSSITHGCHLLCLLRVQARNVEKRAGALIRVVRRLDCIPQLVLTPANGERHLLCVTDWNGSNGAANHGKRLANRPGVGKIALIVADTRSEGVGRGAHHGLSEPVRTLKHYLQIHLYRLFLRLFPRTHIRQQPPNRIQDGSLDGQSLRLLQDQCVKHSLSGYGAFHSQPD